jgi:hypothetical protein
MFDRRFRLAIFLAIFLAGAAVEERAHAADQSPRQALIEMLTGGEAPFKRHLTVEMQSRLQNLMKGSLDNAPNPLLALTGAGGQGSNTLQAFDFGPILFSFNNPQEHERYELQIDSEEPRGEEHLMGLSLHLVRAGVEREIAIGLRLMLELKRQEGIWRLNEVTVNATLPIGDPRFLEKSWLSPALTAALTGAPADQVSPSPVLTEERAKLTPLRAVRMIGMAEDIYAQKHPGLGYTCAIADLVNVGRGMDEDGIYRFMDADFADGLYNGYRFTLSGCERKPARMFRVVAEPVAGHGKAYCSDNANNLRASDDGRGSTCLTAGKIARK